MALLQMEGFDQTLDLRAFSTRFLHRPVALPTFVSGRLGGLALRLLASSNNEFLIRHKLQPATAEVVVGAAFSIRGTAGQHRLIEFRKGEEPQGSLVVTIQPDTNYCRFKVLDANDVLLETETADFPTANFSFFPSAAWYFIEFKYLFDAVNGAFEVRINGVPEITNSILYNTDPKAIGAWDRVGSRKISNGPDIYVDDMYILDTSGARNNDFLAVDAGGVEVNLMNPDGAGAVQQWQDAEGYSGGLTRHARLLSLNNQEGIVIEGGVAERELYTFSNLTTINQQVLAVQLGLTGFRHQSEAPVQVRGLYRQPSDGSIASGDAVSLAAYKETWRKVIFEENPVDATLFDLTEINDGQFGVEVA